MVGRTMDGEPLVRPADEAIDGDGDPRNAFTYRDDPQGLRCPLGAHIRRSNPRNADLPPGAPGLHLVGDAHARLRRRGARPTIWSRRRASTGCCGAAASTASACRWPQALAEPRCERPSTGLHFICLGANIARQFEFVQNAWMSGVRLRRPADESDPLLGNRLPATGRHADRRLLDAARPTVPTGACRGLPQFVTVLGGAYFFLPGIRALRYLATAP